MTITVKELYDATLRGEGIIAKHARDNPDMPIFVLIAQDNLAAGLVEKWTSLASSAMPTIDSKGLMDKINEARLIADFMYRWPVHKTPD